MIIIIKLLYCDYIIYNYNQFFFLNLRFDKFEAWAKLAQQWLECYAIGNILSQLTKLLVTM